MNVRIGTVSLLFLLTIIWTTEAQQNRYISQICNPDDFRCSNGKCIESRKHCDRVQDCPGGEDEQDCECTKDEFKCLSDGACIEIRKKCDGVNHCKDSSDEYHCNINRCPSDKFACNPGSTIPCATRCDGLQECDTGEDELNCGDCNHECDDRCLEDRLICNGYPDCSDGSDELQCDNCDGLYDFRCTSGECINTNQRCNGLAECVDFSDEQDCNHTILPTTIFCNENQYQCRDGSCIDSDFHCDGRPDCIDQSDEENCGCDANSWQCLSGVCIPKSAYCDGIVDCPDNSDESDCQSLRPTPRPYTPAPSTTSWKVYTTTYSPLHPYQPPITNGPIALNLKTYPDDQVVRHNVSYGGDVVFQCRDEGPQRVPVRWIRDGGKPLKTGSIDRNGRLEMNKVTPADSGVYICQATRYLGYPGAELRVTLNVEPAPSTPSSRSEGCAPHQATCGNGECISKALVCNGRPDCSDGSDEDSCNENGMCEPNQFKCNNKRCVLKTWICDFEDDCGDRSDEQNCGTSVPGQPCLPVEFACSSNNQCVPKSFHCDGQSDCLDGSDEIGCAPVHVIKPPHPSNVKLNPGETLNLVCEAVGVPTPLITWRLNWGHVPEKCTSMSDDGVGSLVCPNMQSGDNGAYSCEAMNNRGTTFAAPDSIVFVNRTDICGEGYFNSEARTASECIRCFCFGESTSCRSADLYTYNMPTPLGEGGTRLVGIKQSFTGEVHLDVESIANQYYYEPLRNGATVTKLVNYDNRGTNAHPYLTLPESYNGNQLTSYGGRIKYKLSPHAPRNGFDNMPDIIIKGNYATLLHTPRPNESRVMYIEARLTPPYWQKAGPKGPIQATREDIMMTLDNIDKIFLRADSNDAGSNITEFAMESAHNLNSGLGLASLVEECRCPPGYEGLSCQKCSSGYVREKSGPWLGHCLREEKQCPLGYYFDTSYSQNCEPCPCPLTNRENQFARTCAIGSAGKVICDCALGYEGPNCEVCGAGYVGNPLIPGDSCRPAPVSSCNPIGSSQILSGDQCICKENVEGRFCDKCKNGSFYLSQDFRQGCAHCFCSGVSETCTSSSLRRKTITVIFNEPRVQNQVKIYTSARSTRVNTSTPRYNAPIETSLRARITKGELKIREFDREQHTVLYWSLPDSFTGDKVTSYGGYLRFQIRHVPEPGNAGPMNYAPDIQLISDNRLSFHYYGRHTPLMDGYLNASVQLTEVGWQRSDGKPVTREHFLLALADVKTILIKATYTANTQYVTLVRASIDIADIGGNGPLALHVEQCVCPVGYVGTSCEDCAPGYKRSVSGLYLEHCVPCECNGHSAMCNPQTGDCYNCADNTEGANCEKCRPGYERDAFDNCKLSYQITPGPSCFCDPRGIARPCDQSGYCECKLNVEGESCDRCRPGSFGLDANNPSGCINCYCSGMTSECHEGSYYIRMPIPAPVLGEQYGGYKITNLNADLVINDHFVPDAEQSELRYIFPSNAVEDLYWSLPVFPGNRVLAYGGNLSVTQKFQSSKYYDESTPGKDVILFGDEYTIFWVNHIPIIAGETPTSYQVPLTEDQWRDLATSNPISRPILMSVLKNLRRVLVRATLSPDIQSTAIADVSMETATDNVIPGLPPAKGIEVCVCPQGYTGTSCENCQPAYYKDAYGTCQKCPCNSHECQLNAYNEVECNCRPPYTGSDCSILAEETSPGTTNRPPPKSTVNVVIASPTLKIQEIGSSVNFSCAAESYMSRGRLPVKWSKADGLLPQDRAIIHSSGMLVITNLQISDSGKYICETSDGISTAQAIATLKVPGNEMTIPSVTVRPAIQEYYEGDRIQLECIAIGNPTPRITWQRASNKPLPLASENYESYLIIDRAGLEDSGEYSCIASNPAGTTARTAIVNVRRSPLILDRLTISPSSANMVEGQSTKIMCTGTKNIPPGSIGWFRQDGTKFLPNVKSDNGVLYIDVVSLENQGVYLCRASVPEVPDIPILVTVQPLVTMAPEEPSNITVSVDRLKIPEGGIGKIECSPRGYPLPLVKWQKHQGELGPRIVQRENTLIINNAKEEDQGYYMCEGTVNGAPVANTYVFIEVEKRELPRVEIWPQGEQLVPLGGKFELHCRVLGGYPEPTVTWSRGRNSRPEMTPDTSLIAFDRLLFSKVDVNDEGEYVCTAANQAGSVSDSAVIRVRSPPEVIITPNNYMQALAGEPVTVECRGRGLPEPMVSITRVKDYREMVEPNIRKVVLNIPSASDDDDGEYICRATSLAGTTEDKFVIRVDRGDGGFEGSGENIFNPDLNQPRNMIAIEGQESRISCDVSNEFEVKWSRHGRELQINAVQRGSELIIYNTAKKDAGWYECTLYNRYGEVQQSVRTSLMVMAAPSITLRPSTQTVHPGQSPTVECIVEGDEITEVNWRPVDRPMSRRVEINGSTLIFHQIEIEDAGQYECFAKNRVANATAVAEVIVNGPSVKVPAVVEIQPAKKEYNVGENLELLCRATSRGTRITWERYNTNQFVETRPYGEDLVLVIAGIGKSDEGVYRCKGRNSQGQDSYEDFYLKVVEETSTPFYPIPESPVILTAHLKDDVDLPCNHNLEQPVSIEWRREYTPLQPEVRTDESVLRLRNLSEADAGTYVCRISNSRAAIETRAILRVTDLVPRFNGEGWLALPTLKDAYRQFDIEISFNPADNNGLILFNGQNKDNSGDFIALQLVQGVPQFIINAGDGPLMVSGDRPLQLNTWHTIRLSKSNSKVTMDVDNTGPFIMESPGQWEVLDLNEPLYIGGVEDYNQLPYNLAGASGFVGCVSMLILGREEKNIMLDSINKYNVKSCDSCAGSHCMNDGVCQEARNERGYMCICRSGFTGQNCDRTGEACRPGLCGPGKCTDTFDGYKCACPVTYTGRNCDVQQSIEYPAFTGSAYLAIKPPKPSLALRMSMKVKPTSPVTDGIIMYCAESARGHGGFTSLAVHDEKLEYRYDVGDGNGPVILTSKKPLQANEWTDVDIARVGPDVSLKINSQERIEGKLKSVKAKPISMETPMFVGGVDESIILNNNTGVTGGFSGCIKEVKVYGQRVNIVNSSIQSANVQECSNYDRGDIPEMENICSQCRNGGYCEFSDSTECKCPPSYTGTYCETRVSMNMDPCAAHPCRNGGNCKLHPSNKMNYTCDCPLGYAGSTCQMPLELRESVGFNGNGYLELPASLLRYNVENEPVIIGLAIFTKSDGVLFYQGESTATDGYGDFILLRVSDGVVVIEWDLGGGIASLSVNNVYVNDGDRHVVIVKLFADNHVELSVDEYTRTGNSVGFSNYMNADSNIYIGGIPERKNVNQYPGLTGCLNHVELMDSNRAINLGRMAIGGWNAQRCRELRPDY